MVGLFRKKDCFSIFILYYHANLIKGLELFISQQLSSFYSKYIVAVIEGWVGLEVNFCPLERPGLDSGCILG